MPSLKINEIYHSVQGESSFTGLPCVFIRTSGCSLRCRWCDTDYAFYQGTERSIEEILTEVKSYGCPLVEVTGGEPLDQPETFELLKTLCNEGYTVLLETGGHRSIEAVDPRVHCIVDVKCPGSHMERRNHWVNFNYVSKKDEVKFVIAHEEDYLWARDLVRLHRLDEKTHLLFSVVDGELEPQTLVEWILRDHLPVRFQLQLHKVVWGKNAKSV